MQENISGCFFLNTVYILRRSLSCIKPPLSVGGGGHLASGVGVLMCLTKVTWWHSSQQ